MRMPHLKSMKQLAWALLILLISSSHVGCASQEDGACGGPASSRPRSLQPPNKPFLPLTDINVVYDTTACPSGYVPLSEAVDGMDTVKATDLNSGANGVIVTLCLETGGDWKTPINEISISADSNPCPQGWEPVMESGSDKRGDLNKGTFEQKCFLGIWPCWTVRKAIHMCYLRSETVEPLYHLRVLDKRGRNKRPYSFNVEPQDLNGGLGERSLYMGYSRSPSMLAAAISLAGKGTEPHDTLDWASAVEDLDTGTITVTLRLHCEANGQDYEQDGPEMCMFLTSLTNTELHMINETQSQTLCEHARKAIEAYWSGFLTLKGVTRYVAVKTIDTHVEPKKDVNVCVVTDPCGENRAINLEELLFFEDDAEMTLFYQAGVFNDTQVAIDERENADAIENFGFVAAHEIGHSFLAKYGGLCYSGRHKGTSDINFPLIDPICDTVSGTEYSSARPECPGENEIVDMMKYYNDHPSWDNVSDACREEMPDPPPDFFCPNGVCCDIDRVAILNEDRSKVIMTARQD